MKIFSTKWLSKETGFLLGISLLFFALRFPSLYEPYWYGDEGIYLTVAKALHAGQTLYRDIWDNKPPLLYWLYFMFTDMYSIRMASLLFGLGSLFSFFTLSKQLFSQRYISYIITTIFALFLALPTIEGNIANAENFMLFPIITGMCLFWNATARLRESHTPIQTQQVKKILFLAGSSIGIGFLLKTVAIFDFSACLFFGLLLILEHRKTHLLTIKQHIRIYFPFVTGFVLPFVIVSILFLAQGILPEFLTTIFLKNVTYVGENNAFFIPQGFLLIKLLLLVVGLNLIYIFRKKLTKIALFLLIWLAFSLFNVFFSQRPYTHYLLVVLPSIALLVGLTLSNKQGKQQLAIGGILIACIILLYNMFPHWNAQKTNAYYQNFLGFVSGQKSYQNYLTFFDWNTPRDYAIADYLALHVKENDTIFIWGNSAQIYYLSDTLPVGRYTVAYHIITPEAITETGKAIQDKSPQYVVILPTTEVFPLLIPEYAYKLTIGDGAVYEKIN